MIPLHLPPGDPSTERTLQIDGTSEQIEAAKQLVSEVTSEVCLIVAKSCRFGLINTKLALYFYIVNNSCSE